MAALVRNVISLASRRTCSLLRVPNTYCQASRGYKQWARKYRQQLYKRRTEQGPEPDRHRSVWVNWNYDAEIYAFGKRLGEEFNESTLRTAFTERSYIEKEEQRRAELGVSDEDVPLGLEDNSNLAKQGEQLAKDYITAYLRHCLPNLPEEGVWAICDYLLTDKMLAYVGSNLGIKDLILTEEFPPSDSTISKSFKAVIGALLNDQGPEKAHLLIQDFIITQLIGKELGNIWTVVNPMGVLEGVLKNQGGGLPEPRLLWQTGSETMVAAYIVGIYSDKKLIGKSPGETVSIAEEMAARDALQKMFCMTLDRSPFPFGKEGHKLKIDIDSSNPSLSDYTIQQLQ